ncbi:MAG: FkbM family methyltransferase [Saccharofermentans sp.]|nr:FkbM family methyltransferase [Saccharofermentans sp.]
MDICEIKQDLWDYLKASDKPVALYGTGDGADKIIAALRQKGLLGKVKAVFASDGFVRSRSFAGFKVRSYSDVAEEFGPDGFIALMCFGSSRPEVLDNVAKIRKQTELYAPDVPVCGTELFDMGFYKANEARIQSVYEKLEDEESRKIFKCCINFKLSGKVEYLDEAISDPDSEYSILPEIEGGFIDLGAYNGDTLTRYMEHFPGIDKAFAVEPERHSFKKLDLRAKEIGKDITLYNALVGDHVGEAVVTSSHGRGTRNANVTGEGAGITNASGTRTVPMVTIDSIAGGRIGFIKFDVEGEEINAIEGGRNVISNYRPCLKIACYHQSPDIFEIPEKILEINPDYKLYLRRLKGYPCWDLDYLFV